MSEQVAVRDAPLLHLTVWHEAGPDGRPACRQGAVAGTSYRLEQRSALPEGVTKCDYCAGEHSATLTFEEGSIQQRLLEADPEEVPIR